MFCNQTYNQALMTDLYQLTMAAGYFENKLSHRSTFELYFRKLPLERNFMIAAGLEQALEYLEHLRFLSEEIAYLKNLPVFKHVSREFFDYLSQLRFSGDMWAIPEGTPVFPNEPLLRISAPVIEAQLVETFLLSMVNFQTLIAGKAGRVWLAARQDGKERAVLDFGTRRAHGPEAGVLAARAAYIAGCAGTSNVLAGMHLGLPVYGTAAHSWTMAFEQEAEAFQRYNRVFPDHTTLLIDTYDTLEGARKAVQLGRPVQGVRLDSGDLYELSCAVRRILDQGGLATTQIYASGDLNEHKIAALVERGAPIDAFGVGTEMVTSKDAPALGGVYKLVEQQAPDGHTIYKIKLSASKATYPAAKQVFRHIGADGRLAGDIVALATEEAPTGAVPLLVPVMQDGRRLASPIDLAEAQARAMAGMQQLPQACQSLMRGVDYPVGRSRALESLFERLKNQVIVDN